MVANDGTGIVTITPSGTDTINGNSNQQLQLTESLVLVSNGASGWNTYGYGRSNTFAYTQLALTVTGGSLTLTSPQASNTIQTYSGTLLSNQIVYLPSTVQLYSITNSTMGSFTLTFRTVASGGAILAINPNQSVIAICDGTNVYNANTYSAGSYTNTSITLAPGSAATPTFNYVGDLTTGIYQPTSSQVGITITGTNVATFSSSGLVVPLGISGGSF
jgi:hypothetical protein